MSVALACTTRLCCWSSFVTGHGQGLGKHPCMTTDSGHLRPGPHAKALSAKGLSAEQLHDTPQIPPQSML